MFYNSNNPKDSTQSQSKKSSIQEKLQIYNGNVNSTQTKPNPSGNDNKQLSFQEKLRIAQGKPSIEINQGNKQDSQVRNQTSNLKMQESVKNGNNQQKEQPKQNLIQDRLKIFNQNSGMQQQKAEKVDNDQNKNLSFKEKLRISQGEPINETKPENQQTKPTINKTKEIAKNENNQQKEQPKPNLIQERLKAFNKNSNSTISPKEVSVNSNNNQNFKEKLKNVQNESSNEIKLEKQQATQTVDQTNNLKMQENAKNGNNQQKEQPKQNLIQDRLKIFNQNSGMQQQKAEKVDNDQNKNLSFKEKLRIAQGEPINETKPENQQTKPTINQTNNIKSSQDPTKQNLIQNHSNFPSSKIESINNDSRNLEQIKNENTQIKPNYLSNKAYKQDEKLKTSQPQSNLIKERLKIYNTDSDEIIRPKKEHNNENGSYLSFKEKLRIAKGELPNVNEEVNTISNFKAEQVNETKIQKEQLKPNPIQGNTKELNGSSQTQKKELSIDKSTNLNFNDTSVQIQKEQQSKKINEPILTQGENKQQEKESSLSQEEKRNLFLEKIKVFNGNFLNQQSAGNNKNINKNNSTNNNNIVNKSSNINDNKSTNPKNKTTSITNNSNINSSSIIKNTKEMATSSKKETIKQIIKNKFQKFVKSSKKNSIDEKESTCQAEIDPSFQTSLNDLASEITIDFQNRKIINKIKEIEYNILESTAIFDKKYCIILKNSLRTYIKSVILEIIMNEYNEIPKQLIPKVYQAKINLMRDSINKFVSLVDVFYDEKVGNENYEEDITDKTEMEANSMLYVMSEKESFKEIKIDITCEASLRSQIPQDF